MVLPSGRDRGQHCVRRKGLTGQRRASRVIAMVKVERELPASRLVLRDGVYERILDLLLSGRLQPGDRVGIDSLAAQLDVSPTPVREALATLENTGLIQRNALRGYRVAPPLTVKQLNDLIDARRAVELCALHKAMENHLALEADLTPTHEADLRVIQELHLDTREPDADYSSYRAYFVADWAFHDVILRHSDNDYLIRMGQGLSFQAHRLRQTFGRGVLDAPDAAREHAAILEAVRRGDQAAAVAAMEHHLEQVRSRSLLD